MTALSDLIAKLESALERLRRDAVRLLNRTPVRNFDETLAEVDSALREARRAIAAATPQDTKE
jgi:hypothetical protein